MNLTAFISLREILSFLINPLPILYLLLLTGTLFLLLRRKKTSRWFFLFSALWLLAITTSPFPRFVASRLENTYPPLLSFPVTDTSRPVNILVLGGGHTHDLRFPPNDQLSINALGRLAEGIRLYRQIPRSRLITSGYAGKEDISQAMVMYRTALLLGVDSSRLSLQEEPRITWHEALSYRQNFDTTATLIIVTDAIHMPRAMMLFRKAGLHPIAAPTNHLIKKGFYRPRPDISLGSGNIKMLEAGFHELTGLVWGWIRYPGEGNRKP